MIVIGSGRGGATCGYAIARAGLQELFCEHGASHLDQVGGGRNRTALTGHYPEGDLPAPPSPGAWRLALGSGKVLAAPHGLQFDAYRGRLVHICGPVATEIRSSG